MPLNQRVNELDETSRTSRATQISGRQLLRRDSAAGTEPSATDCSWLAAVSVDEVSWLPGLRVVTLSQSLLQLVRQWHLATYAFQVTIRRLDQNVAALGAMEFHGA